MENQTINYLTYDQALTLVDRIADRTLVFDHKMTESEKEAMAELLSAIGVKTSDLICVKSLADNYAINAEIITQSEANEYETATEESLFSWEDAEGNKTYCMSW